MNVRLATVTALLGLIGLVLLLDDERMIEATSFNPTLTVQISSVSAGAPADQVVTVNIPEGDAFFAKVTTITPAGWGVPPDAGITDGSVVGNITFSVFVALFNNPCVSLIPGEFSLLDATTNTASTVPGADDNHDGFPDTFEDWDRDGLPNGVELYPAFLTTLRPGTHYARLYGQFKLSGVPIYVNFLFDKTPTGEFHNEVFILDPTAEPAPSPVSAICTPFNTQVTLFGVTRDNPATASPEGGQAFRTNPLVGGLYTFRADARSNRDLDDDGVENSLDICAFTADSSQADADRDFLGDACDPEPSTSPHFGDQDEDGFLNDQDNCPLVVNNNVDRDEDDIGDACDPQPDVPNGHDHTLTVTTDIKIETIDRDADGVGDSDDNCPRAVNGDQADADGDGLGDACDPGAGDIDIAITDPSDKVTTSGTNVTYKISMLAKGGTAATGIRLANSVDVKGAYDTEFLDFDSAVPPPTAVDESTGETAWTGLVPGADGNLTIALTVKSTKPTPSSPLDKTQAFCCVTMTLHLLPGRAADADSDGVPDLTDNCPTIVNPDQADRDGDGLGDACDDSDGDGIADSIDQCPTDREDPDGVQDSDGCPDLDNDGDGVNDDADNCPDQSNPSQTDTDADGLGDPCDPDDDADGILDVADQCPTQGEDFDGISDSDGCPETDADGDGVPDTADNCPTAPNPSQEDADQDGIGDACDTQGISVTPGSQIVAPGSGGTFVVSLDGFADADGLGAYQWKITYNPSLIQVTGVTNNASLPGGALCSSPSLDNTLGAAQFACTQSGIGIGPTGSFALSTVSFTSTAATGTSVIHLVDAVNEDPLFGSVVSDTAGELFGDVAGELPLNDGSIVVGSGAAGTGASLASQRLMQHSDRLPASRSSPAAARTLQQEVLEVYGSACDDVRVGAVIAGPRGLGATGGGLAPGPAGAGDTGMGSLSPPVVGMLVGTAAMLALGLTGSLGSLAVIASRRRRERRP